MRNIFIVLTTGLLWAIVCGFLLGACALLAFPDPGHVGRPLETIIVASMSAVLAFFAGLVFAILALAVRLRPRTGFAVGAVVGIGAAAAFEAVMFAGAHAASGTEFGRWAKYSTIQILGVTLVAAALCGILGAGTVRLLEKRSTI